MRVILLGSNGLLGSDFFHLLTTKGHVVDAFTHVTCDITKPESIAAALKGIQADVLINCAAYTQVDRAETEQQLAREANAIGVANLCNFCRNNDVKFVHFSTDYVFNGQGDTPYQETDPTDPINYYGTTKRLGEEAIINTLTDFYLFRIQWIYGKYGKNFVKTITEKTQTAPTLSIICNQWGSPTWTYDIARYVTQALEVQIPYGIYHLTSEGYVNWADFARFFLHFQHIETVIQDTTDFSTLAKRPLNSRLSPAKLKSIEKNFPGINPMPSWQDSVINFLSS